MLQLRNRLAVCLFASSTVFSGAALAGTLPVITTESTIFQPAIIVPASVNQQISNLASIPLSVYTSFTQAELQQISDLVTELLESRNFFGAAQQQQLESVLENVQLALQQ